MFNLGKRTLKPFRVAGVFLNYRRGHVQAATAEEALHSSRYILQLRGKLIGSRVGSFCLFGVKILTPNKSCGLTLSAPGIPDN